MDHSSPDKRIGTADRNHALDVLGNFFADGYLTLDEFDSRSQAVTAAVYRSDLEKILGDLPTDSTEMAIRGLPNHRAEMELADLKNKGKKLKFADGFTIAFMVFCFVVSVALSLQWLMLVGIFGTGALLIGSRAVIGVSDSEEDFLEEIDAKEYKDREERLRIALERRKELGN